jgi:hypothetical protein
VHTRWYGNQKFCERHLAVNRSLRRYVGKTVIARISLALFLALRVALAAEDRDAAVRNDLTNVVSAGGWIYNDLPAGFAEAAKTRKPMLVIFRCVP